MQSIESNVSNFKVNPVFNRKPVKLPKKRVSIGLVRIKTTRAVAESNFLRSPSSWNSLCTMSVHLSVLCLPFT